MSGLVSAVFAYLKMAGTAFEWTFVEQRAAIRVVGRRRCKVLNLWEHFIVYYLYQQVHNIGFAYFVVADSGVSF